jgi:hypothetical protein
MVVTNNPTGYAFVFFMSAFMGNLFFAEARAEMLANPGYWLPDILSIAMALLVAALTLTKKVPLSLVMNFGLAFLVTSNYGIAISEFINPERLDRFGWVGLSWVAVWTPLYSSDWSDERAREWWSVHHPVAAT